MGRSVAGDSYDWAVGVVCCHWQCSCVTGMLAECGRLWHGHAGSGSGRSAPEEESPHPIPLPQGARGQNRQDYGLRRVCGRLAGIGRVQLTFLCPSMGDGGQAVQTYRGIRLHAYACCFCFPHGTAEDGAEIAGRLTLWWAVWRGAGFILLRSRCVAFGDRANDMRARGP